MTYVARKLDTYSKLKKLGEVARFDVCGFPSVFTGKNRKFQRFKFIYPAVGKRGSCVRLFKVLQSNACEGNCFYCANRKDRNFQRINFRPDELAKLFLQYYSKGLVDGLFLSSAINRSVDLSEERMFETVQLLRTRYGYRGYIHYKVLPGTDESIIDAAARLADRLSLNLEAPSAKHLAELSPSKNYASDLVGGLEKIARINRQKPLKAGITTQLVVGAARETDREILNLSGRLYEDYKLWRVYYSAFMPILDTPLEELPPCSPLREYRLYQADFLLRRYGFTPQELPFEKNGNLPQDCDPKLVWALRHQDKFPMEINKADFHELLRVPGIGIISARRIVETRKQEKFTRLDQLRKTGALTTRAGNFLTLQGRFYGGGERKATGQINEQLFLWEEL
ncbi:radical SAM protein [Candidatus Aerophobetes bacterium Ae_b3b]|nr:MAG: radical SAM protein [Candidatus Aerophobetes bacterium Ae_b3b]